MARSNRKSTNTEETPMSESTTTEAENSAPEAPAAPAASESTEPKVDHPAEFKAAARAAVEAGDVASATIPEDALNGAVEKYRAMSAAQRGKALAEIAAELAVGERGALVGPLMTALASTPQTTTRTPRPTVPAYVTLAAQWAALHVAGDSIIPGDLAEEDVQKARDLFAQYRDNGTAEGLDDKLVSTLTERIEKAAKAPKRGGSGGGTGGPRAAAEKLAVTIGQVFEGGKGKKLTVEAANEGEKASELADGTHAVFVTEDGVRHSSPTAAAKAVSNQASVNGRRFWNIK